MAAQRPDALARLHLRDVDVVIAVGGCHEVLVRTEHHQESRSENETLSISHDETGEGKTYLYFKEYPGSGPMGKANQGFFGRSLHNGYKTPAHPIGVLNSSILNSQLLHPAQPLLCLDLLCVGKGSN